MRRGFSARSAASGGHAANDQLAVVLGVAVERLQRLRALEVEVQVVFPGEADAAVHLDGVAADLARGVADVRLRHRGRERAVLGAAGERPRCVVGRRVRVLDLQQHLGALVADRLEGADRLAELLAHLRVLHGHVQAPARGAQHLGGGADGAALEQERQGVRRQLRLGGDGRAVERHLRDPRARVQGGQAVRAVGARRRGLHHVHRRRRAAERGHQDDVGDVRPRHELLDAAQRDLSAALLGARLDRLRAPIERPLHQRHRRPRAAAGDGGQPAALLGGAAEAVDGHGRQHGRQIRRRARGAPELFLEDGRLHEAEGAAAGVLGQGQAEPAELRHLLPQRLALAARVVPEQTHLRRFHVLVEEGEIGVLQELLVGAEGKVHGALLGLRHAVGADLLGETEHALADDVLLDLRRARINRARARPQERVRPARPHAGRRVDVERGLFHPASRPLAVGAEDLEAELVVALLELAVGELGDRRRRAGRRALLERGQHPEGGVPLYFHLRVDVPQLGAHHRILEQRLAAALDLLRGVHETVEGGGIARHARHRVAAALEAERRLRDLPALAEAADEVALLGARVGHEDLVELRAARDLLEGAHLHAGLAHVEQEARDPLVLGHAGIAAREQDAPVRDVAAARPDLLTVDEEVIAPVLGARAQAGEVRARVRLGVQLAPHLLGGEDLSQITLLLLGRAVDDDGRPDEPDAEAVDRRRRVGARHLVGGDGLLHRRRAPAAVLRGPTHADVAGVVHRPVPGAALLERLELGAWHIALKPRAGLVAERAILGREIETHHGPPVGMDVSSTRLPARQSLGRRQTIDRGVQEVGDEPRGLAGGDHEVQLHELAALLLEERAHLAARGQPLADARAAEVAHGGAGVDPRAHRHVAIHRAVALLEQEAGVHPAAGAAVERQRLAHLGDVRLGGGDVGVRARRAERGERGPVSARRLGPRLGQQRLAVAGQVHRRREARRNGRRQRRALGRGRGGRGQRGRHARRVARGDDTAHDDLLPVEAGPHEADAGGAAPQPGRAERDGQRLRHVGVHGHAGDEGAAEAVAPRGGVVVDLVLAGRRVLRGHPIDGQGLGHGVEYNPARMRAVLVVLAVVAVLVIALVAWYISVANDLVRLDQDVNASWAQVQTQYQRRLDLIPNVEETVRGFAKQERTVLTEVTQARANADGSLKLTPEALNDPQAMQKFAAAQGQLSGALSRLLVTVERYPELKSDRVFQGLMTELEGTENRIAVARRNFNEAVKQYNGRVQFIPGSLVASMRGYRPKPFFEAAPGAETAPKVKF